MKAVVIAPQAVAQRLRLRHTIPLSCPKRHARLLPSWLTAAEPMVGRQRNPRPVPCSPRSARTFLTLGESH
jgi:hypothetical protein